MRLRYDVKTELALALMPTITIILVLIFVEAFTKQRLLFSSLASSAFLIYLDPKHQTNQIRTLAIAQSSAACIGFIMFLVVGTGYPSAALSMIIAIALMIFTKSMHPPAVSTALIFAFRQEATSNLYLFLLSLGLLVILIVLQRMSLYLVKKAGAPVEGKIK
jgi:CBS-domain-containing membrane protein